MTGRDLGSALEVQVRRVAHAPSHSPRTRVVILAGGRGTRLAPYTSVLPKPLLPVGDRAIIEIVLGQLASFGLTDVTLCVGYLSHLIRAVLDDGAHHGVEITYVHEDEPFGTAGPLRFVPNLNETFISMNGDVLTTLDYRDLVRLHKDSGNVLTIAAHVRQTRIDYGVLRFEGLDGMMRRVSGYEEKPELSHAVSMGVYVLEPEALDYMPDGDHFDFPDLVERLLDDGRQVGAYPFEGFWLDIGRHEDYVEANRVWETDGHLFITP
jgi:NDP-sugar pyrophosphorylase family protein